MSIYLGTQLLSGVATNTVYNANNLLDFKWSDYQLSDQSWLRADTFSWQDGTVYSDAYNHLVDDWNNWWATHQQSEMTHDVIDGQEVWCITASDGHKIAHVDEIITGRIDGMYNATGVAWYYVLDTANQRFKLPRTKFGFIGLRDTVGKYVTAGLPNITGSVAYAAYGYYNNNYNNQGAFKNSTKSTATGTDQLQGGGDNNGTYRKNTLTFSASDSNSIYGNSTTVQPPATQMYLYFYVGQFSQSATEQTAGLNAELFNGKADRDLNNLTLQAGAGLNSVGVRTVVETYTNGKSWYRIWSDGWIEQGGYATSGTISLLKTYTNANYAIKVTPVGTNNNTYFDKGFVVTNSPTTTQFNVLGQVVNAWYWQTAGY